MTAPSSYLQVYRFHPTPEEQVWQGLPAGDEGEAPGPSGASPQRSSEAFPPGCSAGEVKMAAGLDLIPHVGFPCEFH